MSSDDARYRTTPSGRWLLEVDGIAVEVDPGKGGRATAIMLDGIDVLASRSADPAEYGMYPMAPWAGRLRGNRITHRGAEVHLPANYGPWALHGTILDRAMDVTDVQQAPQQGNLVLSASLGSTWPWPGICTVVWEVTVGQMSTTIEVSSTSAEFPAVVGWHPWFRRHLPVGGPVQVDLPADQRLVCGSDHLPTGESVPAKMTDGPFDDAFRVPTGTATVTWPGWKQIEIINSHSWFVLFDELPEAVCVEPQSGPPDGVNGSPVAEIDLVTPQAPLRMQTTWRISPAPQH
ncbi:MAG: aldose 1-epimerase [Actinomycetales bacterium]